MKTENPLDSYLTVGDEDMTPEKFEEFDSEEQEIEEDGGIFTDEQREDFDESDDEEDELIEEQSDESTEDIPFNEFITSWKSSGLLSKDFKLPDKPTITAFKEAIFDDIYKPLKEAAESKAEDDYEQAKINKGLHTIEIAEKIANGVSPTTASDGEIVDRLISLDIASDTDESYENREKLIRTMHQLKGVSEKKIDKLIQMSQDDGEDQEDAEEAKKFLKNLKETKEAEEIEMERRRKEQYEEGVKSYYNLIKGLIDKGDIIEGVNKDTFFSDLTEPSVYVDIDNGERKVKRKFSKWQKAQMDAGVVITPTVDAVEKKDVKKYLEMAHQLMYGDSSKKRLKEKVKKEVEDELDSFLTKRKPTNKNTSDFFTIKIP